MSDKKRDILDLTSLQLKAKPPEGAKRPAGLSIKTWNNKVSFTVFTNLEHLPRKGIIGFNLFPLNFYQFLASFEEVIKSEFTGERITKKMTIFDKAQQDKKPIGDLVWGRDQEGVPYICVVSAQSDFPKVVFRLEPSRIVEMVDMDRATATRDYALGWVHFWREMMVVYLKDNFVDETQNQGGNGYNRGGNGGGYNNRSGGNNYSSNYNSDDIPM